MKLWTEYDLRKESGPVPASGEAITSTKMPLAALQTMGEKLALVISDRVSNE